MTSSPAVKALRSAAAYDGRSASARIDRVEERTDRQDALLVSALGPELLRQKLGQEAALAVIEGAGMDPAPFRDRWAEEQRERERASQQVSTRTGEGYDGDPMHDPRVLSAIMQGTGNTELQQVIGQVRQEYAAKAARKANDPHKDFMWIDSRTGQPRYGGGVGQMPGVQQDANGNPVQRSVINSAVAPLGSEEVGSPYMGDIRSRPACGHPGGGRYCPECGQAREA